MYRFCAHNARFLTGCTLCRCISIVLGPDRFCDIYTYVTSVACEISTPEVRQPKPENFPSYLFSA